MREIKFRAWDTTYNKMVHSYVSGQWKLFVTFDGMIGGYEDDDKYEDFAVYGDRFIPMQYIGYGDINRVDIYEGDILQDEFNRIMLVEWRKGGFCFKALTETNFKYAHMISEWFEFDVQPLSIIGNMYDNPELMERI